MRQIKRLIIDNILPDWYLNIRRWRKAHGGAFPRIRRPITFNEKILHRNLFERCPIFAQVADKAAVRSYVEERLGPEILPTVYHLTSDPRTIPFDRLPDKFVVKPTHGSGWVKIVTDKSTLDPVALVATCAEWLKRSYYKETREIVYKHIKPRIIIEEFIDDGNGSTPNDYKLFVFDGVVKVIQTDVDRFTHHFQRFYTPEWQKIDVRNAWYDVSGETTAHSSCRDDKISRNFSRWLGFYQSRFLRYTATLLFRRTHTRSQRRSCELFPGGV